MQYACAVGDDSCLISTVFLGFGSGLLGERHAKLQCFMLFSTSKIHMVQQSMKRQLYPKVPELPAPFSPAANYRYR